MNACAWVVFRLRYCQPKKYIFLDLVYYPGGQVKVTNSKKSMSMHEKN